MDQRHSKSGEVSLDAGDSISDAIENVGRDLCPAVSTAGHKSLKK